jgi:wyosine [tRNA(Phe)-imidazoG37] synthetase (radical SAM superfamily)
VRSEYAPPPEPSATADEEVVMTRIAFGPVPSRRLGRSLGINNIPPKVCSYSCAYCQLGRTDRMLVERGRFYGVGPVVDAVEIQVEGSRKAGEAIDFLAFVPDGEPTLDRDLGETIRALKTLRIPIAVITNGSLLDLPGVRDDLMEADWVSAKVDAVREPSWRSVDRPHGRLSLASILEGVRSFAAGFSGVFHTETMLLEGLNDGEDELRATAGFLESVCPQTAYLSIPTRPPSEPWVRPPGEAALARAFGIFSEALPSVELLTAYEGDAFSSSGDARRDLLSITAVHPMRESAVRRTLEVAGSRWSVVSELLESGELVEVEYEGHRYFLRPVNT